MTLLDSRVAELDKLQHDLHAEQQELERARQRMESELSERAHKLERLAAQLAAERQNRQQCQPPAQVLVDGAATSHPRNDDPATFLSPGQPQGSSGGGSAARKGVGQPAAGVPQPRTG